MKRNDRMGHVASLLTVLIWGTTFISTKTLLTDFQPAEILLFRFVIGFLALIPVYPRRLKGTSRRQEWTFAAAGLCGICLYYLLENVALTCTTAANVGVSISVAPFFTAVLSSLLLKEARPRARFYAGFAIAMAGIVLISLGGLEPNPIGDLLALLAALVWAFYAVLTKKISAYGYSTLLTTRRVFFYGILFMLPAVGLFDFGKAWENLSNPVHACNILFLGLGASALCFVTWNFTVKTLGAVRTSAYIYMVPVITLAASVVILHERLTVQTAAGALLTLSGLLVSEEKLFFKERGNAKWRNKVKSA